MNRRSLTVLAAAAAAVAALALVAAPATALTSPQTSNITVTASVNKSCFMNSPTLAFGSYDYTSGTPLDVSTNLVVNCTKGTPFTVTLGNGANFAAGRFMKDTATGGTDTLHYELYKNSAGGTVWDTTAGGSVAANGTVGGNTLQIFGRVFINQNVAPSSYQDTVQATVTF